MLCNNHAHLCDRTPPEVLFAGTHNSMSSAEEEWIAPNHNWAIPQQLQDGIRALNIDTYWWEEEAYMCHSFCEIGAQPLSWATDEIASFLSENPNTVLIITFQSTLSAEETLVPFVSSGLRDELYEHQINSPWPTLRELIDTRKRLLVFSNSDGGEHDGYMAQWEHWVDTPYSANSPDDFGCFFDRGDPQTASLYNINHFLTNPVALPNLAETANQEDILHQHIERCIEESGRFPSQILVDFYRIGSVLPVVDFYNQEH